MKQENNFDNTGYQPMSYEEAENVRRRNSFDRDSMRDGSNETRPYNPFTRLGDRPKMRIVGVILTSISLLILFSTITF